MAAAALAPDDGSNLLLRDLQRARPEDVRRAATMLRSMPQILRWIRRSALQDGTEASGAPLVAELCSVGLVILSSAPPPARIATLAMLTAESVRHPTLDVWSAPGEALAS